MKKPPKKHLDEYFAEARAYRNTGSPAELLQAALRRKSPRSALLRLLPAGLLVAGLIAWPLIKENPPEPVRNHSISAEAARKPDLPAAQDEAQPGKHEIIKSPLQFRTRGFVQNTVKSEPAGGQYGSNPDEEPAGVHCIMMGAADLKKLGFELLQDGSLAWTYAPYHDARHIGVRFQESGQVSDPEARTVEIREHFKHPFPSFVPARISDLSGTKEYFAHDGGLAGRLRYIEHSLQCSEDESREGSVWTEPKADTRGASNYLPVRAGNFILWFAPGEELLQALPEPVCSSVFAELGGREPVLRNPSGYPENGFCYLDLCEKNNGAISCSKVFPNPARESRTSLSYELSEPRSVEVSLFDLSGRKLRELAALREHGKGRHEMEIPLDGVEKGIYLLVVGSDKGERLSRRLILE